MLFSFENDARALCFAWYLTDNRCNDLSMLRLASEMGYAFACSLLSNQLLNEKKEEAFRLAQFAAAKHEVDGFVKLARCFYSGIGCEKDLNLAHQNLLLAAELGLTRAAIVYGRLLDSSDPARWLWWSRAALRGSPTSFVDFFPKQVELFFSGSGSSFVLFLIGHALKGNIDMEKKRIFGVDSDSDARIGLANQAVSFYSDQIKSVRHAVDTWTLISTRLHVMKDMRIYIGKMIWEARFEANYKS